MHFCNYIINVWNNIAKLQLSVVDEFRTGGKFFFIIEIKGRVSTQNKINYDKHDV